ncbi:MAG TPA: hypothetical protein VLA60_00410 [Nitrospirales bacterium]|nr:hypothetical protein [Nitrospirales bacterium]
MARAKRFFLLRPLDGLTCGSSGTTVNGCVRGGGGRCFPLSLLPVSVQPLAQTSAEKMLNERAGCMLATPFAFLFNDTNHSLGRKGWAHLISSFAMSSNALA